jgi:phosphopantothenoylcysteine decarboxylase/phosphopantothenate--cysteine ligase
MGYALADAARAMGAQVTLISGPTALPSPTGVDCIYVDTAEAMLVACTKAMPCDVFIAAAAVADYRPVKPATQKLPKQGQAWTLDLVPNPDILATIAALPKGKRPYCVGFAAQTEDVIAKAQDKLVRKGADVIVANQVGNQLGFHADENQVSLVTGGGVEHLPLMAKTTLARLLLEKIVEKMGK